ncbi:unnamed protein product [Nippostrongylus brasiliensis]|uniref:Condensin-2 complex subunit D3 (inferred by orthology to a human protein) n=1 Tax=Nippostrongylus brasiliensis TaxID=27835 RepID=A0A0N4Y5H1_NIPBR|nr:unnamed protein product [Nippostrongylus brasiliensis]
MAQLSNFVNFIQTEFSSVRDITREWVMASTENNYSDFAAISSVFTPSFYEALEAKQLLRRLQTCLSKFATENNDPEVFDELSKADVSARQISVLLWYSIEWALAEDSTFEQVEQGGFAACAYLHLCCISGATAYKVFNPYLFQKCLDVFRRFYRYLAVDPSAPKSASKKATKSKSGVVKKGKKRQCPDTEPDQNDGSRAAEVDLDEAKMLLEEACAALFEILGKVSLADYAGVPLLVTLLVRDIARIDVSPGTKVDMIENVEDFKSLPRLSDRSFALMHRLMEDRHTKGGFLVISRIVYPRLSYWTFECDVISSSMAIPAVFNTWKSLMVDFIKVRVKVASDAELLNYFNVLENLYQRCTDRLEYRTRLATSLVNVLQLLPRIYQFVGDGGSSPPPTQSDIDMDEDGASDISSDRSKSPESRSGKNVDGDKSDDDQEADNESNGERTPPLEILYKCFIRCTLDKASTVRVRALHHLVPLIENGHLKLLHHYARQMFEEDPRIFVGGVSEDGEERPETNLIEYGECFYDKSEIVIDDLILYVILAGCGDDVAGVRKNALTALQCYFPHITSLSDAQDAIEWLVDRCLDQSPTVRKQAAEVFDYLLTNSTSYRNILEKEWLAVVLLMINDREQSVQQLISQIIVGRIIRPLMNDDVDEATWRMLHAIELEDNNRRLLLRALLMQYQEGTLKTNVIDHLNRKLVSHPDQADAIWMLLADMSSIMTVKSNRALDAWYSIPEGDPSNRVRYVAKVLAKSSKMLDSVTKSDLCADLDRKLTGFKIDVSNISAAYYCLAILMDAVGEEATGVSEYGISMQNYTTP